MAGGKNNVKGAIEQAITHCWQRLGPAYLKKLVRGMPKLSLMLGVGIPSINIWNGILCTLVFI